MFLKNNLIKDRHYFRMILFAMFFVISISMNLKEVHAEGQSNMVIQKVYQTVTLTLKKGSKLPGRAILYKIPNRRTTFWQYSKNQNILRKVKAYCGYIDVYPGKEAGQMMLYGYRLKKIEGGKGYYELYKIKVVVKDPKRSYSQAKLAYNQANEEPVKGKYGVFLGLNGDMSKLAGYDTVVIEPEEYSASKVKQLKDSGKTVLGYLNAGAIENNRSYYNKYKKYALGDYRGWPDEKWMNISKGKWQKFVLKLANKYVNKGFDGFYVDNLDVYSEYKKDSIYKGGLNILRGIKALGATTMVNGGDLFVRRALEEGYGTDLIDVVNQEEVFTQLGGSKQDSSETKYFDKYLRLVSEKGISVTLLEYGKKSSLENKIANYCAEHGFFYYYSPHKNLD